MIFSELEKRYRAYRLIKKWAHLYNDLECAIVTDQLPVAFENVGSDAVELAPTVVFAVDILVLA